MGKCSLCPKESEKLFEHQADFFTIYYLCPECEAKLEKLKAEAAKKYAEEHGW